MRMYKVSGCVVGEGPAGWMLTLLFAAHGVQAMVLEMIDRAKALK